MVTWTDINVKLDHLLSVETSTGGKELQSLPHRINSWNWAQDVFVHHTPLQKSETIHVESGGRVADFPSDLYVIDRLYDANNERFWWPVSFRPGDYRYADEDVLQFWVWGSQIILEKEILTTSQDLTLYYWAYYPQVTYTTSGEGNTLAATAQEEIVYTPRWAEPALMHLCVSFMMVAGEIFASDINEYRLAIEAGNPIQNPRLESSKWHMQRYLGLVAMYPRADLGRAA